MSRRALAPVDRMTTTARGLSLDNLSARITVPDTGDELARLAQTWNEVLAQLELAVGGLTRFTADASHELKTPIAIVRATVDIALRRDRTTAEYRKALKRIEHETEFMTQLIDQLLWLARADAGAEQFTKMPLDLREVLAEACGAIAPVAAERGLTLQTTSVNHPVVVEADPASLRRLILLVLDNALKYTPERGRVHVSLSSEPGAALIAVHDNGIGIRAEDLPLVFDRFWRADKARTRGQGTGLGLSIARKIAEMNSAHIEAQSEPGDGTTFRMLFPLTTEPNAATRVERPAELHT
jgi:signal transduction histidine kinase